MKLQIESTEKIVTLDGVSMRLWEGTTESGVPVVAFVARVAVPENRPQEEYRIFETELRQLRKPSPELAGGFDARMVS